MNLLLIMAGYGQIALALASTAIPYFLKWREDTAKLQPITRQIFWVYAAYIFTFNLSFGILSAFGANLLLDHSTLATIVTGFIAVYWCTRITLQFACIDRSSAPKGLKFTIAEIVLVGLFFYFSLVYLLATCSNLNLL